MQINHLRFGSVFGGMVRAHRFLTCPCKLIETHPIRTMIASKTLSWCARLLAFVLLATSVMAVDVVPLVRTKTDTYKNVTLVSRTTTHVFVQHSRGMATLKMADLDQDVLVGLGVLEPEAVAAATVEASGSSNLAKSLAPIGEFAESLPATFHGQKTGEFKLTPEAKNVLLIGLGIIFLLHIFFSYCSMLICKKSGTEPGILVWLPILQMIPLIRAAGMSGWWFLGCFVPVLNIIVQVLWAINIAKARGKGSFTTFMLILPLTNVLAFLYLAFSGGSADYDDDVRPIRFEPLPA